MTPQGPKSYTKEELDALEQRKSTGQPRSYKSYTVEELGDLGKDDFPQTKQQFMGKVAKWLPTLGAMAVGTGASIATGGAAIPAILGAFYGGGSGQIGENLLEGRQPMEDVGPEAAKQGAYEALGRGTTRALGHFLPTAEGLYKNALTFGGMEKDAARRLPETVAIGLRDPNAVRPGVGRTIASWASGQRPAGVVVSPEGKAGVDWALNSVQKQIRRLLTDAESRGLSSSPSELARHLDEMEAFYGQSSVGQDYVKAIQKFRNQYLDPRTLPGQLRPGGEIMQTPTQIWGQRQADIATKGMGGSRLRNEMLDKQIQGAKDALAKYVPEINHLSAEEQKLLDLDSAIEDSLLAQGTTPSAAPYARVGVRVTPHGPSLIASMGIIKSMLVNPAIQSKLAIAMDMWARRRGPTSLINLPNVLRATDPARQVDKLRLQSLAPEDNQ